jgi:hypothetical protein
MLDSVSSDIRLKEKSPRVLLVFASPRQRAAMEEEYGTNTILKMVSGAMDEIDPDCPVLRIQLPPGKNDPLIPLLTVDDRETYKVAVFERVKYIESTNIVEYIFRSIEAGMSVDEDAVKAKAAIFRPGLRYS